MVAHKKAVRASLLVACMAAMTVLSGCALTQAAAVGPLLTAPGTSSPVPTPPLQEPIAGPLPGPTPAPSPSLTPAQVRIQQFENDARIRDQQIAALTPQLAERRARAAQLEQVDPAGAELRQVREQIVDLEVRINDANIQRADLLKRRDRVAAGQPEL